MRSSVCVHPDLPGASPSEHVDVIGCAELALEEQRPVDGGDEDSVRTATA